MKDEQKIYNLMIAQAHDHHAGIYPMGGYREEDRVANPSDIQYRLGWNAALMDIRHAQCKFLEWFKDQKEADQLDIYRKLVDDTHCLHYDQENDVVEFVEIERY